MKIFLCAILMWIASCFPLIGEEDIVSKRMLGDLEFIKNILQTNYAPTGWKMNHLGWSLESEFTDAADQIHKNAPLSTKEFQKVIKSFIASTKDYHVDILYYSTEMSSLPFTFQFVNDKFFITLVNSSDYPFQEGDELISFGGVPIREAVQDFVERAINGTNPASNIGLAGIFLTHRLGEFGHDVQQGKITIEFQKKGNPGVVCAHELEWEYEPELISEPIPASMSSMRRIVTHNHFLGKDPFFEKNAVLPQYEALARVSKNIIGCKWCSFPQLGRKKWKANEDSFFESYIFLLEDGAKAGFIRIPTYYSGENADQAVGEFAQLIRYFQKSTDVLVIDQTDNPGGNLIYLYSLVSMLSDKPLEVPKHRVSITQEDVYYALQQIPVFELIQSDKEARKLLGNSIFGIPVNLALVKGILDYLHFILDEWNAGKHLTDANYLFGIGPIQPSKKAHYTKPILVLINSMDFSGGDFFPAILQDNKRATIMGTPTAGAGGFLNRTAFPNLNGIAQFTYTASFAERVNQQPIENIGVIPDIWYEISENDLLNDYDDYRQKIVSTLKTLYNNTPRRDVERWKFR